MAKDNKVTFIGAGNVAHHLAPAMENHGYAVQEVFSRTKEKGQALVEKLYDAEWTDSLNFSSSPSTLFVLAVKDDALKFMLNGLQLPADSVLVHCSGTQPMRVLQQATTPHLGVLYPFQTFSMQRRVTWDFPVFWEAATETASRVVSSVAKQLSPQAHRLESEDRKKLHTAGVFASNFVNYVIQQSFLLADEFSLNKEWLYPLLAETVNKAMAMEARDAQTGPARRNDGDVIRLHETLLSDYPTQKELYQFLTQKILHEFSDENGYQP